MIYIDNELIAASGMWLYNGNILTKRARPVLDSAVWQEITDAEAEEIRKKQENEINNPGIESLRTGKISEIEAYYNSDEINLVSVQGVDIYLSPELRFKLSERLTAAKANNIERANITLDGYTFNLLVSDAEMMLNAIVLQYAAAYDVKEAHIKSVNELATIEEIQAYNVRTNYPKKLVL